MNRMCAEALPDWIPRYPVPNYRPTTRAELKRQNYRSLGSYCGRDATMWVPGRWYWYAKLELFLQLCWVNAFRFFIRRGFMRGPEGGWFQDFRFDPPDLWGSPVAKHERGYARRYRW